MHYLACLLCTKAVANALSKGSLPVSPYNCRFLLFTETSSLSLIKRCNKHLHSNYPSRCELHASGYNRLTGWFLHAHTGRWGNNQVQQVAWRMHWVHVSDSNTHTHPHTERKLLKVYSGKLKTKTRQHTHLTHMHASHTTWLINSNLNGRGLTSYTHAFWWCLEKTLQHLQRARERVKERERERQTEARLNVKVKNVQVSWRDQERLVEWQLGVAAQSSVTAAW